MTAAGFEASQAGPPSDGETVGDNSSKAENRQTDTTEEKLGDIADGFEERREERARELLVTQGVITDPLPPLHEITAPALGVPIAADELVQSDDVQPEVAEEVEVPPTMRYQNRTEARKQAMAKALAQARRYLEGKERFVEDDQI